ncbi:Sugar transporter ESL1 [Citrus sinensis]|uniref:Sugar transporter ESL1 n=1 Tax=Citrus sinensis TaxID=2711 RepID=A0ACB8KJV4_CITSI|nr:Sugar transporter ESL1 [Citrus sinensis]
MENPESLEEGLIAKSSLAQPNPIKITNEVGERSGLPESDNSSATPVVVLSTLVAICGSFAHGCSLSNASFFPLPLFRSRKIMMETSESLEEGLIPNPPLLEPTPMITNEIGNGGGMSESDFSTTPAVVFSTLVAICGSFTYGCAVGYSSAAESGMRADLGLSVTEYSVFGSVLTFGGIIGSLVNGKIADVTGRRGDAWSLYLGRFSLGIGLAIIAYVVPIYVAEITPKNIRGAFTATNQFLNASGLSVMYLVGIVVSWRALALIAAVPCLLQVVGLFFIPESPRWLAKIGKEKELEATLQCLRGKTADISMESTDIRDYTQTFEKDSKAGIFDLFQQKYAYSLSVGVGLMVLQPLAGSAAIAYYASYIFAAADLLTNIGSISMAIIQASTIGMGLGLTIIALAFGLQDTHLWNEATPVLVYIGIMGFSIAYSLGMAGLPSVIMSEIFPINIKGSAGSLVILLHNCSNWIVTYTFHFMMEWSRTGTFSIFWVICAAAVAFAAFLVPETKGRTLEEIQISITKL